MSRFLFPTQSIVPSTLIFLYCSSIYSIAFEVSYPHHHQAQLARMTSHLDQIVLTLPDSPLKILAVSLAVTSLGYSTFRGLNYVFSRKQGVYAYPPGPKRRALIGSIGSYPKGNHPYDGFCEWARLYGTSLLDMSRTSKFKGY